MATLPLLTPAQIFSSFSRSGNLFEALYKARPSFLQQQAELLSSFGPALRGALFAAVPEFAQISDVLTSRLQTPIPQSELDRVASQIRTAQAARGFTGGGTGPVGQEVSILEASRERNLQNYLGQAQAFAPQLLAATGLAPPNLDLAALGGLFLSGREQQESINAARSRSLQTQSLFDSALSSLGGGGGVFSSGGAGALAPGAPNPFVQYTGSGSPFGTYYAPYVAAEDPTRRETPAPGLPTGSFVPQAGAPGGFAEVVSPSQLQPFTKFNPFATGPTEKKSVFGAGGLASYQI
jgi:hypothetical protein